MCTYAVVSAGGGQLWVEPERVYDIQPVPFSPGDRVLLPRVLLMNCVEEKFFLGGPYTLDVSIKAVILGHAEAKKVKILKMQSKKKTRKRQGYRAPFSRILVDSISVIK
ncbi:ribosomal protein L21 (plastid) [Cryptomonas paramecium]|uniref:Large ribosomal subunit protein bL21m n=1 Tax=Cryptomonas paramaecium TaxID=2898 RepID=D2ISE2_9CRYP|nr:ribosomal protein L21 [Cryptomonas paramecium]ACT46834.1 ribosomal protein L21 [Cryptomonas paramecium]BDA98044.1 ribosomal protein L21 [Cryptomonas paramecium]